MAASSHLLSASPHLRIPFHQGFLSENPFSQRKLKVSTNHVSLPIVSLSQHNVSLGVLKVKVKPSLVFEKTRHGVSCAANMAAAGHSDDPERNNFHHITAKAREVWDSAPKPVRDFPWNRALGNFIQLTLDLVLAIIKILSVPLLAISSLSEMSYCAHQRKLTLVPIPLLIGVAVAWILKDTALELSPLLKDAEVPWHLIVIAIFFTLLKLAGPYYPYWGRIFIPHLSNGVLARTMWSIVTWNNQSRKGLPQPTKSPPA